MAARKIAFKRIADAALSHADTLVRRWLPDGRREGPEWIALNPTRSDGRKGSFKINLTTGMWSDFAVGDAGGDLVALAAYLFCRGKQGEAHAVRVAARCWGSSRMSSDPFAPIGGAPKKAASTKPPKGSVVMPVPPDASPAPTQHPTLGTPSAIWTYRNAAGATLGFACRFDPIGGKQFRPLTLWRLADGTLKWQWESWPTPRPLYGLQEIAARRAVRASAGVAAGRGRPATQPQSCCPATWWLPVRMDQRAPPRPTCRRCAAATL